MRRRRTGQELVGDDRSKSDHGAFIDTMREGESRQRLSHFFVRWTLTKASRDLRRVGMGDAVVARWPRIDVAASVVAHERLSDHADPLSQVRVRITIALRCDGESAD